MKKLKASLIFVILIAFISICFIYFGWNLPTRSKVIPYWVASFLLIFCAIQFLLETIPKLEDEKISKIEYLIKQPEIQQKKIYKEKKNRSENDEKKKLVKIFIWILFLVLGLYLFGFLVILPIFISLFYLIECSYKLNTALAATSIISTIIYLFFEIFLDTELYRGLIF